MVNKRYDLLTAEMEAIASKVKLFPAHAQDAACNHLITEFLNGASDADNGSTSPGSDLREAEPVVRSATGASNDRNYVADLRKDVEKYRLANVPNSHFAVYAVQSLTAIAPNKYRVESVNDDDLKKFYALAGCKPSGKGDYGQILRDAKSSGNLETPARGQYVLSDVGKFFLENTLLKEDDK